MTGSKVGLGWSVLARKLHAFRASLLLVWAVEMNSGLRGPKHKRFVTGP